ncbi:MAG TPA: hypothetical protein PLF40_11380 [Kofleriaceae bacterium]|nr:hypothetical protein [Kofleriaceae bacterium]
MIGRNSYDSVGRAPMYGASAVGQDAPVTQQQPAVGKLSRVQAEMGQQRAKAGSVMPAQLPEQAQPESLQGFTPTSSLALGPENEPRTAADVGAAHHGLTQQVASTAPAGGLGSATQTGSASRAKPAQPRLSFEHEYADEKTGLKLRAKVMRRDGVTSRGTQKVGVGVGPLAAEYKLKEEELKVVLSQKGAALQETLASAEVGLTFFEGMKISIKLAAFETKVPLDYSLLKLTIEGAAVDVPWFTNTSWAGEFRVDVTLSWSKALDKALLTKLITQLAPFEKAAQEVAALTKEAEEVTRKIEAATKVRDAARAEQTVARQAEGAAAKAKKAAMNAERAAAKAEQVATTAEARAVAQGERAAQRAAIAAAKADVKAAQIASNAATKLLRAEEAALAQHQRALKLLAPRLKAAGAAMAKEAGSLKHVLAKQIGARVGKVLATRAGQALMKALPVIGWVLLAKDVYDIASLLLSLEWKGGRFFGQDGEGAGDAGVAANSASTDAFVDAPPAPTGGVDVDGGDADRGVDGAGTTGVDQMGAASPQAKPAQPTSTPQAARQSSGDHATHAAGPGKQGSGGSGGSGNATPTFEPVQPTKVPATGSAAPSGDTANKQTGATEVTGTSVGAGHSDADRGERDAQSKVQVADQSGDQSEGTAAPSPQPTTSKPTAAQANSLKRQAQAKAERKAKAAAEAAERQRAANELADRRLFWGGDQQILAALHWDGAALTKKIDVLNAYITQMQQHPRTASNGAQVALRRMQVTIGKPMGTQIPVEAKYLAEQQQGAQWVPCAQDAQSMLYDTTSSASDSPLSMFGDMHAELFDSGVLQVKNGNVVVARKTFTIAGAGTFELVGKIKTTDRGDHWKVTVTLKPLDILDRKIKFHVDGGQWVELGSSVAKDRGLTMTLKHSKTAS